MPPLQPLIRRQDSDTRGRHLAAAVQISKGELVFCERPMISLQSTGNVFSGALTCHYCGTFIGTPEQALTIATDPMQLPKIATSEDQQEIGDHSIVPCQDKCGAVYCSTECQMDDFEFGGHKELCTGLIEEENHPLVAFKRHAIESNEIFLLIAQWIARIHNQKVPYHDDENQNTHPYTDFMMTPWWDVVSIKSPFEKSASSDTEIEELVESCKRLCKESHAFLQQAWSEHKDSKWLTPLGMARLIGSLEQNCVGVRRKHALRMNILEDEDFRQRHHEQLLICLESAGMTGDGCGDECCDGDEEEGEEAVEAEEDEQPENDEEPSKPASAEISNEEAREGVEEDGEEDVEYSVEELAEFFSNFPSPLKTGADDEWDDIITPMDGTAHYSTLTKMNHDCTPNIVVLYKTRGWGRNHPLVAYCVALKDIAPGEELTISYIKTDQSYNERQSALSNYGFLCECNKCKDELKNPKASESDEKNALEQEEENLFGSDSESENPEAKNDDVNDLFGSDDEDDKDENDGNAREAEGEDAENDVDGETKLQNALERFEEDFNKSTTASIPLKYFAPASTHVIKICSSVLNEMATYDKSNTDDSILRIREYLSKCLAAVRSRHFVHCLRMGTNLESFLYQELQSKGSWPAMWYRHAYWCACISAAIGYAHECSFLIAMQYLDKAMIMGQERQSPVLEGLISYVEHFAHQMAAAPCPPCTEATVINIQEHEERLRSVGLSNPIQFPATVARTKNFGDFVESLGSQSKPVVIRRFANDWEAVSKWRDLRDLARDHGHRLVPIEVGSMDTGMKEELVSFRTFVTSYLAPSTQSVCTSLKQATDPTSSIAYLAQHPLLDQIPSLYQDVPHQPYGLKPTNVNVWMGTGGTRTPLHFDSYDNVFCQLVGAKYVRLYDKSETSNLYVSKESKYGLQGNMSAVNCEMEDFEKHPKAKKAKYTEVLLLPGDAIFIPARCWHYVRSLSTSISVNYWF